MVRRSIIFDSTTSQSRLQGEYPFWDVLEKLPLGSFFAYWDMFIQLLCPMLTPNVMLIGIRMYQSIHIRKNK